MTAAARQRRTELEWAIAEHDHDPALWLDHGLTCLELRDLAGAETSLRRAEALLAAAGGPADLTAEVRAALARCPPAPRAPGERYEGPAALRRDADTKRFLAELVEATPPVRADFALFELARAGLAPRDGAPVRCTAVRSRGAWRVAAFEGPGTPPVGALHPDGTKLRWGEVSVRLATPCPRRALLPGNDRWRRAVSALPFEYRDGSARILWDRIDHPSWEAIASASEGPPARGVGALVRNGKQLQIDRYFVDLVPIDGCAPEDRRPDHRRWSAIASAVPYRIIGDRRARVDWATLSARHELGRPVDSWATLASRCDDDPGRRDPPGDVYEGNARCSCRGEIVTLLLTGRPTRTRARVSLRDLAAAGHAPVPRAEMIVRARRLGDGWLVESIDPAPGGGGFDVTLDEDGARARWGAIARALAPPAPRWSGWTAPPELRDLFARLPVDPDAWLDGRLEVRWDAVSARLGVPVASWDDLRARFPHAPAPPDHGELHDLAAVLDRITSAPATETNYDDLLRVLARGGAAVFDAQVPAIASRLDVASSLIRVGAGEHDRGLGRMLAIAAIKGLRGDVALGDGLSLALRVLVARQAPRSSRLALAILGDAPEAGVAAACHRHLVSRGFRPKSVYWHTLEEHRPETRTLLVELRYDHARLADQVALFAAPPHALQRRGHRLYPAFNRAAQQGMASIILAYAHQDDLPPRLLVDVSRLRVVSTAADLDQLPIDDAGVRQPIVNWVRSFPLDHVELLRRDHLIVQRDALTIAATIGAFADGARGRVAQLYAIRKSGKSTFLLSRFRKIRPFVYVNAERARLHDPIDRLCRIEDPLPELVRLTREACAASPYLNEQRPIVVEPDGQPVEPGHVLILDEVDHLGHSLRERPDQLAALLDRLAHAHPTVIVGLDPDWHHACLSEQHTLRLLPPWRLEMFGAVEIRELGTRLLDYHMTISPELADWLQELTGGHPTVVRYVVQDLMDWAIEQRRLAIGDELERSLADAWWRSRADRGVGDLLGPILPNIAYKLWYGGPTNPFHLRLGPLVRAIVTCADPRRQAALAEVRRRWASESGTHGFDVLLEAAILTSFVTRRDGALRLSIPLLHDFLKELG